MRWLLATGPVFELVSGVGAGAQDLPGAQASDVAGVYGFRQGLWEVDAGWGWAGRVD